MNHDIWNRTLSRRAMLRAAGLGGLAVVAAACTGNSKPPPPTPPPASPGTIGSLRANARELSLLTGLGDNRADAIQTGKSVFIFDLAADPQTLLQGGTPQLFVAKDENSKALGPFPMTWSLFTGYAKTGDKSPKSDIPGIYWGEIDIPSAGIWTVAAVAKDQGRTGIGVGHVVVADDPVAAVGTAAMSAATPVATTPKGIEKICTRVPVDDMHYISLDEALTNGKPTVVSFATPKFCSSRLCGPVVDEQLLVFQQVGKERANFIHVEEFPTQDVSKPAPAFVAWGFQTEPWVIVIDADGAIWARFLGPATAGMIESALTPLLG
jgi:hypothetical protein